MRKWLIDLPAAAFDAWWIVYRAVLIVVVMTVATGTLIALVLEFGFGIRFGW